ncbi:MAG: glycosyltransferase family 2 protein [Fibrobacterota bacterium]
MAQTVSIIIPACNEAASIGALLQRVRAAGAWHEIIVVDDGSTDATAAEAEKAGARVVMHPYNVGNGAAVRSGIRAATGEVIVMLDGDGQHPPEAIPALLAGMAQYHMAVAARTSLRQGSFFRNIGNRILIAVAQRLTGAKIADLTSGFRVVRRSAALPFLHLFPNRYSYPTTLTMCFVKAGLFIKYEPVESIKKREQGKSQLKPLTQGLYFLNIILRMLILFEPQKFFVPLGTLFSFAGTAFGLYTVITDQRFEESALLLIILGVFFFLFGLLAEQVSALRRQLL